MPHHPTPLALAAIDGSPRRHDGREHAGRIAGPGWFDSSWDLHCGLEVREGWSDDERVHGWIEDFLKTQRAIDGGSAASETLAMA